MIILLKAMLSNLNHFFLHSAYRSDNLKTELPCILHPVFTMNFILNNVGHVFVVSEDDRCTSLSSSLEPLIYFLHSLTSSVIFKFDFIWIKLFFVTLFQIHISTAYNNLCLIFTKRPYRITFEINIFFQMNFLTQYLHNK